MYEYQNHLNVDIHDVDPNGVCRTSALLRYMQNAAQGQLNENGMSYEQLQARHRAFLLSRIHMEFTESPRAYQPLTAISYPCESRGYRFLRCYQLNQDDCVIGRAISVWALMDTETRALIKTTDFDLALPLLTPLDMSLGHFRLPDVMNEVGTYTVNYADLDQNRHMNNTHYPDIYCNFLPMDGYRVAEMSIFYAHEARFGERLRVLSAHAGDSYFFRTIRPDGEINSEAEVVLAPMAKKY